MYLKVLVKVITFLLPDVPMCASKVTFLLISRYLRNLTHNRKVAGDTYSQGKGKHMVLR